MWPFRRVSPTENDSFASGTKFLWCFQSCILTAACAVWPANSSIQLLPAYLQSTALQAPSKHSFLAKTKLKLTRSSVSNKPALRRGLPERPWNFPATPVLPWFLWLWKEKVLTRLHNSLSAWESLAFTSALQHKDFHIISNPIYFHLHISQWVQELKHSRRWQNYSPLCLPYQRFRMEWQKTLRCAVFSSMLRKVEHTILLRKKKY